MSHLDASIVDELRLIMQDELSFLFDAYIEDCQTRLIELAESVELKNCDLTRRIAHNIKGSSRNVGATEFADLCEQLELAARSEKIELWPDLLSKINITFSDTQKSIIDINSN